MKPFSDRELWQIDRAAERRVALQEYAARHPEDRGFYVDERGRVTTPAGITIGAEYTPPPPRDPGTQAEIIQSLLLIDPPAEPSLFERVLSAIDRSWPSLFLAGAIVGTLLAVSHRGSL